MAQGPQSWTLNLTPAAVSVWVAAETFTGILNNVISVKLFSDLCVLASGWGCGKASQKRRTRTRCQWRSSVTHNQRSHTQSNTVNQKSCFPSASLNMLTLFTALIPANTLTLKNHQAVSFSPEWKIKDVLLKPGVQELIHNLLLTFRT